MPARSTKLILISRDIYLASLFVAGLALSFYDSSSDTGTSFPADSVGWMSFVLRASRAQIRLDGASVGTRRHELERRRGVMRWSILTGAQVRPRGEWVRDMACEDDVSIVAQMGPHPDGLEVSQIPPFSQAPCTNR